MDWPEGQHDCPLSCCRVLPRAGRGSRLAPGRPQPSTDKLDWFATFRGRVGVTVTPSVLLYATGGGAWGEVETDLTLGTFTATGIPVSLGSTRSTNRFGWTVGAGIEAMFAANWSAKIEYLYLDMGSISNSVVLPAAAGFPLGANVTSRITDSIIRGGINYRFSAY